jgi:hypothetical protein
MASSVSAGAAGSSVAAGAAGSSTAGTSVGAPPPHAASTNAEISRRLNSKVNLFFIIFFLLVEILVIFRFLFNSLLFYFSILNKGITSLSMWLTRAKRFQG